MTASKLRSRFMDSMEVGNFIFLQRLRAHLRRRDRPSRDMGRQSRHAGEMLPLLRRHEIQVLLRAGFGAQDVATRTNSSVDFSYQSTLRLTTIGSLLSLDFITEGGVVIFGGKPGRGKTHLAVAIAYRALQNGFDALFTTAPI
jgi:DNA replication protein DnaC